MSVNAVTTVSIVPASASLLSCSSDSMPVGDTRARPDA